MLETQAHYGSGRIRGNTVDWTSDRSDDFRKWHPRSTILFIIATCGAFWTLAIWSVLRWIS